MTYEPATHRDRYNGFILDPFEAYKKRVNKPNLVLYRRFYIKWWQIWNYMEYFHPRFRLPYAETCDET